MEEDNRTREELLKELAELRQRSAELQELEGRYRELCENMNDIIYSLDSAGNIIIINKAVKTMLGYEPEEIKGKNFMELVEKDVLKEAVELFKKVGGGDSLSAEIVLKDRDKKPHTVEFSSIPVVRGGRVVGSQGVVRDITGRKRADEKRRESEERFRALFEGAAEGILVAEIESKKFQYANPAACRMLGYTEDELRRMSVMDIHPGNSIKHVISEFEAQARGEKALAKNIPCLRKDGEVIYADINTSKVLIGGKECNVGLFTDVSEYRRMEKELKNSEEKLKILFESAPDAYYLNDLKGNFVDGNQEAERLSGYKRKELIGKNMLKLKLLSLKEIPKAAAALAKNALGQPTGPTEFTLNRKDGSQVAVEIRTFPVNIKGKTHVLGIARDITLRKQVEETLRASLEEKEILLKEIHHRVKNSMQIISSLIRIQSANIKDEKIIRIFNEVSDRIKSMALLYEMLYQSKDLATVDLSEYIRALTANLVCLYRAGLGEVNLRLNVEKVQLDIKKAIPCGLIVTELVSNSLKHAFPDRRKGEIAVEMRSNGNRKYTLVVSDTGVGFPEGKDFHETPSLGMRLVINLVKQLNGTIVLSREKGTEFKIVF